MFSNCKVEQNKNSDQIELTFRKKKCLLHRSITTRKCKNKYNSQNFKGLPDINLEDDLCDQETQPTEIYL